LLTPATWAEEGAGVITERDDVESHALAVRGWSLCSISRHSGRDRKAIRRYVARTPRRRHKRAPTCLEPRRGSIEARFADDPHLEATALIRELVDAGFEGPIRRWCATAAAAAAAGVCRLPTPPRST
jgi:hypothetical protein